MQTVSVFVDIKTNSSFLFMKNIKLICKAIFPHGLMTKDWKVGRVNALVKISAWNIFVSGSGENNGGLCSLHGVSRDQNSVISPWLRLALLSP